MPRSSSRTTTSRASSAPCRSTRISNTWHDVGGINPSQTGEIYNGDAETKSMLLFPTGPGEKTQACPFCAPNTSGPGAMSPIDKLHYIEVAITSKAAEHPHILFTDP